MSLRILQIIQRPQLRGAEIFACQLSQELINQGHTVDVVFVFGTETLPFNLQFFHLNGNEKRRFFDVKAFFNLAKLISKNKYHIVQANAGDTLKYAAASKLLFQWKAKLVFRNANKLSDFLRSTVQKQLNRFFVSQANGVASVSETCKEDFEATFPGLNYQIEALPIGVNTHISSIYTSWEMAGLPFASNHLVFIHVASFVPEKNHEGLLKIFAEVVRSVPTAKLLLIGKGRLETDMRTLADSLGLTRHNSVVFAGARTDVTQILPLCNALVLPSLIEGLPAVILEAMVAKIPVIAYNVGGIGEVINDDTGYLITKLDAHGFASACVNAVTKPEQTQVKILKAFENVSANYSLQVIATSFANFYHKNLLR